MGLTGPAEATGGALTLGQLFQAAQVTVMLWARAPGGGGPAFPLLKGVPWEPVVQALTPLTLLRGQGTHAAASAAPGLTPIATIKLVDERVH